MSIIRAIALDDLIAALAAQYQNDRLAIAELCDNHLDRSGALLGWVRDAAREVASSSTGRTGER